MDYSFTTSVSSLYTLFLTRLIRTLGSSAREKSLALELYRSTHPRGSLQYVIAQSFWSTPVSSPNARDNLLLGFIWGSVMAG